MRQAAAEDRGKDRAILLDLLDQRVERGGESLLRRVHEVRKEFLSQGLKVRGALKHTTAAGNLSPLRDTGRTREDR